MGRVQIEWSTLLTESGAPVSRFGGESHCLEPLTDDTMDRGAYKHCLIGLVATFLVAKSILIRWLRGEGADRMVYPID